VTRKLAIVLAGFAAAIVAVFLFHPAPFRQPLAYHRFADTRAWAGIPNTLNVVSNAGFLAVFGAWLFARTERSVAERTFFLGIFLTSIGSSYYHLSPSNATLPWDRLGMAIAFMALLAILVRAPLAWLAAFQGFGIAAVVISGVYDDLRLYGVAQFYPVLVLLILIEGWLWAAGAAYAIAKVCEQFDAQIFQTLDVVSGHTLKHLFAAAGIYFIWRWLRSRPGSARQISACRNIAGTLRSARRAAMNG
jgi:hypothetical protein